MIRSLFFKKKDLVVTAPTLMVDLQAIREEDEDPEVPQLRSWVRLSLDMVTRCAVEFIACVMFHFIGSVSPTPWANGIVLMVLVYYTAKISGAHLNPAVSLAFCLLGHTEPLETLAYIAAQITGCATGALIIAGIVPGLTIGARPSGEYAGLSGCFSPASSLSPFQIFAWEACCTTSFIIPIFSVVWYTQQKKGYGNTGPLIVGFSLLASALACGQFTGASLNPARTLGSPIVFDCPYEGYIYLYILGEFTGSLWSLLAIVPWYGISRTAWYASVLPVWAFHAAKNNEKCIKLETMKYDDDVVSISHQSRRGARYSLSSSPNDSSRPKQSGDNGPVSCGVESDDMC